MSTESPPSNHLLSLSALLLRRQGRWTQNLTRCDCFALFFLVCVLSLGNNELVIRIQPEEAITLKISNKIPGLGMDLNRTKLNLQYIVLTDKSKQLLRNAVANRENFELML